MRLTRPFLIAALLVGSAPVLLSQNTPSDKAGGPAQILTSDDVRAVLTAAASALSNDTLAAAVVDRTGNILGVYSRPGAGERTPDVAVTLARTGAMFANDQAPLSSRTVRFISGITIRLASEHGQRRAMGRKHQPRLQDRRPGRRGLQSAVPV